MVIVYVDRVARLGDVRRVALGDRQVGFLDHVDRRAGLVVRRVDVASGRGWPGRSCCRSGRPWRRGRRSCSVTVCPGASVRHLPLARRPRRTWSRRQAWPTPRSSSGSSRSWKTTLVAGSVVLWFVAVIANVTSCAERHSVDRRAGVGRDRLGHAEVHLAQVGEQRRRGDVVGRRRIGEVRRVDLGRVDLRSRPSRRRRRS